MGAGRKTQTFTLVEKSLPRWTQNSSRTSRNLGKRNLGGVIFGCTHGTIKECHEKLLFGLPAHHYSYVKNIGPGLPLFLFNYSDRKLHGIFEAASAGQMNINPYGWMADESEYTPYAAQARIRVRMRCQPLLEDQFKPIITANYYDPRHFWFELDPVQTEKLISLFSSFPSTARPVFASNTEKWSSLLKAPASAPNMRQRGETSIESNSLNGAHPDQANTERSSSSDVPGLGVERKTLRSVPDDWDAENDVHEGGGSKSNAGRPYSAVLRNIGASATNSSESNMDFCAATDLGEKMRFLEVGNKMESDHSFTSVVNNVGTSHPQKNLCHLSKEPTTWDAGTAIQDIKLQARELTKLSSPDESNLERESSPFGHCSEKKGKTLQKREVRNSSIMTEGTTSFTHCPLNDTIPTSRLVKEGKEYTVANMELSFSGLPPHLDKESHSLEAATDEDTEELSDEERTDYLSDGECAPFSAVVTGMLSNDINSPKPANILEMKSSDVTLTMLVDEVKELKSSLEKQVRKISQLELDVVKSKLETQLLKDRCKALECQPVQITENFTQDSESTNGHHPNLEQSVLIVGGFDGSSWLSAIDCYYPSLDHIESRSPMSFVRSYASAAKLNGKVYVFGGSYDNVWYDEVESYDLLRNEWTSCPSLNQKKENLAGVCFNDNIYAIGGGNSVECYSEVEIFNLDVGRWISSRSMQRKRFAPAAAEINGAIYVVGGYNGRNYLRSVERLDPRQSSWTRIESMSTRRAYHSLAVLNEKLFAVGGFNGERTVSTVEVFDPRNGSWTMGDSMNSCRGYSATVVIGDAIYVIGGLTSDDEILDTVECHKEGHGWELTNLKAVGKRCFISAVIL